MRIKRFAVLGTVLALAGATLAPAASAAEYDRPLADRLREAIVAQNFKDVIDLTPPEPGARSAGKREKYDASPAELMNRAQARMAAAGKPLHQTPNMDAAIIELDVLGRPKSVANVLLSPQHPNGVVVPVTHKGLSTDQVRYRWWDDTEWDVNGGKGTVDVLPGRENAAIDFSSPYPASVLKLMVGFGVLRLADQGKVDLDADYDYAPNPVRPACGGPTVKKIRQHFDEMITKSQNESTCSLIKLIHDHDAWGEVNQTFADLGMPTLMVTGTLPGNGGQWIGSNMSGLDTAKLLLLVNGGAGVLWTTDKGKPVTRNALSASSRKFFQETLAGQGHNEMLSTPNWCGRDYPVQGIPQQVPSRWIKPDGTVTVGDAVYDRDVRPCNDAAEVTFAHKTGWVDTTGSDAGIVKSLRGKDNRNYIVVVFCNLGTDYVDATRPADPPGVYPVLYTQKYAQLGKAIDTIMKNL
ncbi:serine hydrolase [Lentzea flaviverrucosa]|uniref:Beta-lactamase enzyme family protein n=1 Tax=Lentzea flaviverrucosa TaxID=200379 RepID=A0A1H9W320_9PSEU|nr:serine hydrolase [Lentzea flaviverrucosa]RDI22422.1 beta-lactamase family protein [Lentzea flaviverrucosa]SES28179.1 Beta-lactamase enzyme family protein [Lentzea flaviverrucosa]